MKLTAIMFLLALTVSSYARTRIYGGSSDAENKWSSAVAIANSADRVFCTGVVIASNKVLTAGHCVSGGAAPYVTGGKVLLGVGGSKGWIKKINIAKFEAHPQYNSSVQYNWHDFGLLTLAEDVPQSVKIIPALTPDEAKSFFTQKDIDLVQVGYGRRENNVVGEKYVTESAVTRVFDAEYEAGLGDGRGVCNGDSGGPTFAQIKPGQWRVVGITSRGMVSNNVCQTTGQIFGRVDAAVAWYTTKARLFGVYAR